MKRRSTTKAYARNQSELARLLGVSRETVGRWLKIPGNPGRRANGRMEVKAWTKWAGQNSRLTLGPSARESRNRLLTAQVALVEHRLAVSKRRHIPVEEADRLAKKLTALIEREVRQLHRLAAELEHQPVSVADRVLRAFEDALLGRLHAGAAGIA